MENTAKFCCSLGMEPGLAFTAAVFVVAFKFLRPFLVEDLVGWDLSPSVPLPLFQCRSGLACSFSLQAVHFVFLFTLLALIFCRYACITVITNNHVTESILGCLEISSAKEISSLLLNLASGKVLGQG